MKKYVIRFFLYLLPFVVAAYYYTINPAPKESATLKCMFKDITGLSCTGCGAQRALHNLLHGNFIAAFHNNVLFIIGLPFFILLYIQVIETYFMNNTNFKTIVYAKNTGKIVLIIVLIFTIIRNLPALKDILSA